MGRLEAKEENFSELAIMDILLHFPSLEKCPTYDFILDTIDFDSFELWTYFGLVLNTMCSHSVQNVSEMCPYSQR